MRRETASVATIELPAPRRSGDVSVEACLDRRRSIRCFADAPLPLQSLAQLLWAAQGPTSRDGERTAPSAGALYPLEVYAVAGKLAGAAPGVYKFDPARHALRLHRKGDARAKLARAALRQAAVAEAPVLVVMTAVYARTAATYGDRAERYAHIEVGHAAQNVYLQAQALGLGTVIVGAFDDEALRAALELPADEAPLALMPVGRPR